MPKAHARVQAAEPVIDLTRCDLAVAGAMEEMGAINIYDIYADVCAPARSRASSEALLRALRRISGSPASGSSGDTVRAHDLPDMYSEGAFAEPGGASDRVKELRGGEWEGAAELVSRRHSGLGRLSEEAPGRGVHLQGKSSGERFPVLQDLSALCSHSHRR